MFDHARTPASVRRAEATQGHPGGAWFAESRVRGGTQGGRAFRRRLMATPPPARRVLGVKRDGLQFTPFRRLPLTGDREPPR